MVTAGAVAGKFITGLCRPTAFAAYDVIDGELLGATFVAESAGIHRTAEASPAGGGWSGGGESRLGRTATLAEFSCIACITVLANPHSHSSVLILQIRINYTLLLIRRLSISTLLILLL